MRKWRYELSVNDMEVCRATILEQPRIRPHNALGVIFYSGSRVRLVRIADYYAQSSCRRSNLLIAHMVLKTYPALLSIAMGGDHYFWHSSGCSNAYLQKPREGSGSAGSLSELVD